MAFIIRFTVQFMMGKKLILQLIGMIALVLLTSCQTPPANNYFVLQSKLKKIILMAPGGTISSAQKEKILTFFSRYDQKNQLSLVVKSRLLLSEEKQISLLKLLRKAGLSDWQIQFQKESQLKDKQLILALETYQIRLHGCENRTEIHNGFSCSSKKNLATMLVQPRELIQPQALSNSSATVTSNAVVQYQKPRPLENKQVRLRSAVKNAEGGE